MKVLQYGFQVYLIRQEHFLVQPRLTGKSSTVVDSGRKVLKTYPEVFSFLLKRYTIDEMIADADAYVTPYLWSTGMIEMDFSQKLWRKALRCGNVYCERWLQSLFVEVLLPSIRVRVRNHLTTHPRTIYTEVARFAESYGDTQHAARRSHTPLSADPPPQVITRLRPLRWTLATQETRTI